MYFENLMSTELITTKEPFVARSYDDITNQEGQIPLWLKNFNSLQYFKEAEEGSAAKRLLQKANKVGLETCMMEINTENFNLLMQRAKGLKTTFLFNDISGHPVRLSLCSYLGSEGICSLSTTDPKEPIERFVGFVSRQDFISSDLWMNDMKFLRKIFSEGNFYKPIYRSIMKKPLSLLGHEDIPHDAMDCLSNSLVLHTPQNDQLELWNLAKCFYTCFVLLLIASFILLSQISYKISNRKAPKAKVAGVDKKCSRGPGCRICAMKTYGHQINPRM